MTKYLKIKTNNKQGYILARGAIVSHLSIRTALHEEEESVFRYVRHWIRLVTWEYS